MANIGAMPQVIKNPIPPELTKKVREAVEGKGCFIVINKVGEDGRVHQYRYRTGQFNGEHWKLAYDLLCGDFLSINSPLDKEGLGEGVPDLQGQSSSDRSDRD
jgi:hypothetical protein